MNINKCFKDYYLKGSRSQQLMDASKGFYINAGMAALERRDGSNYLTLVLAESFGIVNDNGQQTFKQIDWTVTGYRDTSGGQTESHSGTVTGSDVKFVKGTDLAGYPIYSFTIPETLPKGYWPYLVAYNEAIEGGDEAQLEGLVQELIADHIIG